jgi:hypothetical protein
VRVQNTENITEKSNTEVEAGVSILSEIPILMDTIGLYLPDLSARCFPVGKGSLAVVKEVYAAMVYKKRDPKGRLPFGVNGMVYFNRYGPTGSLHMSEVRHSVNATISGGALVQFLSREDVLHAQNINDICSKFDHADVILQAGDEYIDRRILGARECLILLGYVAETTNKEIKRLIQIWQHVGTGLKFAANIDRGSIDIKWVSGLTPLDSTLCNVPENYTQEVAF